MTQKDNVKPPRGEQPNKHYDDSNLVPGDAYSDVLIYSPGGPRSIIALKNTGGHDILYSVFVSIADITSANTTKNVPDNGIPNSTDDGWIQVIADKTLVSGAGKIEPFYFGHSFIRVQIKNKVGGQANTVKVYAKGD